MVLVALEKITLYIFLKTEQNEMIDINMDGNRMQLVITDKRKTSCKLLESCSRLLHKLIKQRAIKENLRIEGISCLQNKFYYDIKTF